MKNQVLIAPFLCVFGFIAVLAACSKSSSSPGPTDNTSAKAKLVAKSAWKYDASGADLNKDGTIDIADTTLQACETDNTYLFKVDSTGIADEGATKCDAGDPQSTNFTWKLTGSDQSVLSVTGNIFFSGDANISSVTDTKFVLYKDTTIVGIPLRYIISFKH